MSRRAIDKLYRKAVEQVATGMVHAAPARPKMQGTKRNPKFYARKRQTQGKGKKR